MQAHAGRQHTSSPCDLDFDLLTSRSMYAELLPYSIRVSSLALIALLVFLLECGHTRTHAHTHTKSQMSLLTLSHLSAADLVGNE